MFCYLLDPWSTTTPPFLGIPVPGLGLPISLGAVLRYVSRLPLDSPVLRQLIPSEFWLRILKSQMYRPTFKIRLGCHDFLVPIVYGLLNVA